jgi:hypothetical protein
MAAMDKERCPTYRIFEGDLYTGGGKNKSHEVSLTAADGLRIKQDGRHFQGEESRPQETLNDET